MRRPRSGLRNTAVRERLLAVKDRNLLRTIVVWMKSGVGHLCCHRVGVVAKAIFDVQRRGVVYRLVIMLRVTQPWNSSRAMRASSTRVAPRSGRTLILEYVA
jgi:hypothetical protein